MSEASRAAALQHAATLFAGSANPEATLDAAEAFHSFIIGGSNGVDITVPAKTAKPGRPAKAKTPVVEPEDETPDEDAVTKEQVGESIEAMLQANLRDKAIALFAKFKAKSLSGVKPEDYAAIKAAADDILMSA